GPLRHSRLRAPEGRVTRLLHRLRAADLAVCFRPRSALITQAACGPVRAADPFRKRATSAPMTRNTQRENRGRYSSSDRAALLNTFHTKCPPGLLSFPAS